MLTRYNYLVVQGYNCFIMIINSSGLEIRIKNTRVPLFYYTISGNSPRFLKQLEVTLAAWHWTDIQ
jgi:hypothetical protein